MAEKASELRRCLTSADNLLLEAGRVTDLEEGHSIEESKEVNKVVRNHARMNDGITARKGSLATMPSKIPK